LFPVKSTGVIVTLNHKPSNFPEEMTQIRHPRLWLAGSIGALLLGASLLILSFIPLEKYQALLSPLSPDGRIESLTPQRYILGIILLLLSGLMVTALGLLGIIIPRRVQQALRLIANWIRHLASDFKSLWQSTVRNFPRGWELVALLVLTLGGALLRFLWLNRPMLHDESYSVMVFAARSVGELITDYHLPNNHIFHNLLVHFSIQLFGLDPWAVRLPACLAGVFCIPAIYGLARRWYHSRPIAFLSAALVASLNAWVDYSVNARGYTLMALLTVLTLLSGTYLLNHRNRAAWIVLVILSALGFYTMPVMLYPFSMLCLWMFFSGLLGETRSAYSSIWAFWLHLVLAGLAVGLLTLLLYSPVFVFGTGWASVTQNGFVQPLDWNVYLETVPGRIQETWQFWNSDMPGFYPWVFICGAGLSLLLHWKISRNRVPLQVITLIWLPLAVSIQRINPWSRLWAFLLPLAAMWVCAGLLGLVSLIPTPWLRKYPLPVITSFLLILVLSAGDIQRAAVRIPKMASEVGEVETIALYLKERLVEGDIVVIGPPNQAALWYYFVRYHMPQNAMHDIKNKTFKRAYVVVTPKIENYTQTLESIIQKYGPPLSQFDLSTPKVIWTYGKHTFIYEVMSR
jgi:hypothetical protein